MVEGLSAARDSGFSNGDSRGEAGPAGMEITPALVRAIADRIYAQLLRDWLLERERSRPEALESTRSGGLA